MNILLTGAAGYTGRGMAEALAARHHVRGLDIYGGKADPADELMVGDLTDLDTCRRAVEGREAIVMCHMAPNPDGYKTPPPAIDVNVKGTANLYHAAIEAGIQRVVLVSSTGVLTKDHNREIIPGDGPYEYECRLYVLTKIMQECLARHYFESYKISTVALRPGWIVYDGSFTTKYGKRLTHYHPSLIDPRDIGKAALLALDMDNPGIVGFNMAQDDSQVNQDNTHRVLNWYPDHRFTELPRAE